MPFSHFKLHPDLLKGLKDLGFARPTPIQADAIPPALAGRDLLACAMTGSGKTAAFLLPILHRLIGKPRGTTRALVLTPTRELAAQIVEDLNDLAVHTPLTGAAVFGGVGMGPQEHAFRSGVDVIVAHARAGCSITSGRRTRSSTGLEYLVLDEADRMLDMGFLPDIRRVLRHLPAKRQTLFFSATMPPPIAAAVARDAARTRRRSTSSGGRRRRSASRRRSIRCRRHLKPPLLLDAARAAARCSDALVFTRTKHRANRLAELPRRSRASRSSAFTATARRRSAPQALAGFKSGKYRVLVATDIAARGIDVDALGHVVNFDVPRGARGLHPPRRPHGARRADRRRRSRSCRRKKKAACATSSGRSASGCRA